MGATLTWKTQGLIVLFCTSAYFLLCLVGLDYYQNCSETNCLAVRAAFGVFHNFDFAVVFPIIKYFPMPITLRLFIPCAFLYVLMLFSYFALRFPTKGVVGAFTDLVQLAVLIIFLFEVGLYFLDPDWWLIHFSNIETFPFSVVTNQEIAEASLALLLAITGAKFALVRVSPKKTATPLGTD